MRSWLTKEDVCALSQPRCEMVNWVSALSRPGLVLGVFASMRGGLRDALRGHTEWLRHFAYYRIPRTLGLSKPDEDRLSDCACVPQALA